MLTRLTHAGIAFALTVVIYQAYVLLAVPFIEPPRSNVIRQIAGTIPFDSPDYVPVNKHLELLSAYFPAGHWTLMSPPKSFDNGQAMIVLDDYQPKEDGEVRVNKCAVLFFPHERVPGEKPPRDAVILEAPHGAVIQLDEGFQASFKGIGRLQWARLLGDITVRSDMQQPGPEDDLLLKTRDLYMNQDLIRTDADVDMRLGEHWGKGTILEIRLVAIERGKGGAGPDIGGIDTLEIVQNVEAHLAIQSAGLFDSDKNSTKSNSTIKAPPGELPPVHVTSQGRFKFDFTANLASFVEKVRLEQNYSNGARNRLNCDALNMYLAGDDESISPLVEDPTKAASVAGRTRTVSELHAGTIEAHGTEISPVELNAETHGATAKCSLMRIELGPQRVTFSGQDEVELTYQNNEIHAPMVRYQAPPKDSGYRVGTLLAAGSGWLKALPGEGANQQPFEVRWIDEMELRREKNVPVLSVRGRPKMTMAGGRLWANELTLVLRERAVDGSEDDLLPADVVPARMIAVGKVDIQSAELSGKVSQLVVDVNYLPSGLVLSNAAGGGSQAASSSLLNGGASGGRSYTIDGESLAVEVAVRDGNTAVRALDVNGDLLFREAAVGDGGASPLVVRGKQLRVRKADTPAAEISLKGEPATITAQGMSIEAVELQINRGTSGAMINSPGRLQIPMNRDLAGNPLAQPEPLEISWQGGMNLENTAITFKGDVIARTSAGQLNTNRLVAILSAPIQFDGTSGRDATQLAQIDCWEGVSAQFVQRDAVGTTSLHRMALKSMSANQINGKVAGIGPGWVESVHLATSGEQGGAFADVTPEANFTAVAATRPAQNLRFLRIEFNREVKGSLLERNRRIAVLGNVHTVYGPVDAWEQKLSVIPQGSLLPETIYIESQSLEVAQSPNARLAPESRTAAVELTAEGNVIMEGSAGKAGTFTARGHRAKFDQQKSKFMLEWDGVQQVMLSRQVYAGGPLDEQSFNSFEYFLDTNEFHGVGIGRGQINGLNFNSPQ